MAGTHAPGADEGETGISPLNTPATSARACETKELHIILKAFAGQWG